MYIGNISFKVSTINFGTVLPYNRRNITTQLYCNFLYGIHSVIYIICSMRGSEKY